MKNKVKNKIISYFIYAFFAFVIIFIIISVTNQAAAGVASRAYSTVTVDAWGINALATDGHSLTLGLYMTV